MNEVNVIYFVPNLQDYSEEYLVFSSRQEAEQYVRNIIPVNIKVNIQVLITVLKTLIDLPYLAIIKIPWKYIKNNYKLSDRFLVEFEEYLN